MPNLELKVPPLVVWAVAAAGAAASGHFLPIASLPFPGHRTLAIVLWLAGVAVALAGVIAFKRARTTVNPLAPHKARSVVAGGIYRFTRNPMYLGMAAALTGVAAWWPSPLALAWLAAFCAWIDRFQIRPEERALAARFSDEYAAYAARTRRWL